MYHIPGFVVVTETLQTATIITPNIELTLHISDQGLPCIIQRKPIEEAMHGYNHDSLSVGMCIY